ncbi:uncharacterized protein LOC123319229 [Coccinella septempunctata]|uniref:uncharacterized protein LOC123319229 n=1 Tax=Coccinella septempunctata TaxID=41139 RepID=UPI001D090FBF|nr:uncharacterized protein LOC123319229 [Coccinella septempunctata]
MVKMEKSVNVNFRVQDRWFRNLTGAEIPPEVKITLSLGSKFNIPVNLKEVKVKDLIADVESILDLVEEDKRNTLRAKVTSIITSELHKNENNNHYIGKLYNVTKSFLKTNNQLLVLDSDKGSVTVLMNRTDYFTKMYEIVNTDNFREVPRDPTSTIQTKTNKIISTLETEGIISSIQAKQMKSYNSTSPRMYGNPKIHKENIPMRPIVSDVKGPTCKLSEYIAQILTSAYDDTNNYYVKDSFDFSAKINNFELPPGYVLISLDVVNLFGNISRELVLAALDDSWDKISEHCTIPQEKFKQIITFLMDSGYFMFNGKYYFQMFGCIMGSRLSPIISLYVMDYLLTKSIPRLTFILGFIKKFVDDLIISLPSSGINEILEVFNDFDPNIKFTVEMEDDNNSVPFLDTRVCRVGDRVRLDWYRKETSSESRKTE